MMNTFVRVGVAVTSGAIVIGLTSICLSVTDPVSHTLWPPQMAVTLLLFGVMAGVVTWLLQQVLDLKVEVDAFVKRVSARLRMDDLFEEGSPALQEMLRREEI